MHFWSGCHDNGDDVFIKQAVSTAWVHEIPLKHHIHNFAGASE